MGCPAAAFHRIYPSPYPKSAGILSMDSTIHKKISF